MRGLGNNYHPSRDHYGAQICQKWQVPKPIRVFQHGGHFNCNERNMPHPVDIHVGKKIREVRLMRSMSQADLAQKMEISFQQLQKYETGANRVSASRLYEIAQICRVPVAYFFDGLGQAEGAEPLDDETARLASALARLPQGKLKSAIAGLIAEISRKRAVL